MSQEKVKVEGLVKKEPKDIREDYEGKPFQSMSQEKFKVEGLVKTEPQAIKEEYEETHFHAKPLDIKEEYQEDSLYTKHSHNINTTVTAAADEVEQCEPIWILCQWDNYNSSFPPSIPFQELSDST